MKSFLKWPGGKSKLVPKITELLGDGNRLVEPFCGGGSVFMGSDYPSYLLCDINPDLINMFNDIKYNFDNFLSISYDLFQHTNETEYYEYRNEFNSMSANVRKSAIFLYLNKVGFKGLVRYNKKGLLNVPYGYYIKPKIPLEELLAFHSKSKIAEFICCDFKTTFSKITDGDVIYCDPPYINEVDSTTFTQYHINKFDNQSQVDLINMIRNISNKTVISNHDTPTTRELYNGAIIHTLNVNRPFGSNSKVATEIMAVFN